MNIDRLEELKTIRSDLRGNVELLVRTDDGECSWEYGRELLEELLDAEIARQSVTDEEIEEAIKDMERRQRIDEFNAEACGGALGSTPCSKHLWLAIQALKVYQPVGKADELPCDWCENPRMIDGWISIEGRGASMYIDEFGYCPNCGRKNE